jgi:GrpB-like predicted nucleotidyltransferase (UPF0157 family)
MWNLEAYGIGMERKGVVLAPSNPRWPEACAIVAAKIKNALVPYQIELHHIGSTSIKGIAAKPIIDILGVVDSFEEFDSLQAKIESLGFECKGEYGISGRRYSVLYNENKTRGFVHVHVFEKGHHEIEKHLFFRDFLNQHPNIAKEYDLLKAELREKFINDRQGYSEAKADFIQKVLKGLGRS